MKKKSLLVAALFLTSAISASVAVAEPITKSFNEKGYGTVFGRIQSVTMARDYHGAGNGANSTIGGIIGYTTPEFNGFDASFAYNHADEIYSNNNSHLVSNDSINLLNEGWARYKCSASGATISIGRKIDNGEIFRADDIRQKSRSLEMIQVKYDGIENLKISAAHALKASGVFQVRDVWDFNDFGDIFGADDDTDGVTWVEGTYTNGSNLEVSLFDALAWDVTNMIGTRVKFNLSATTAILGYGRLEFDTGGAPDHSGGAFGLSLTQKVGQFNLEGGYFGVYDDGLKFNQITAGFNHALGSSLMVYTGQWNGGADSFYVKATTKIKQTGTFVYLLCNYMDNGQDDIDGYELNAIVSQPIVDNFKATVKGGFGEKENANGGHDHGTDIRLFLTYTL